MRLSYSAAVTHHPPTPSSFTGARRLRQSLAAALLLAATAGALPAAAQLNYPVSGFTNTTTTWTSILGGPGTTNIALSAATVAAFDDGRSPGTGAGVAPSIGFAFDYQGQSYTQFVFYTNGFMRLGPNRANAIREVPAYNGQSINNDGIVVSAITHDDFFGANTNAGPGPNFLGQTAILAPFNHDLKPIVGTTDPTHYLQQVSGIAPNRVCTIEWRDLADKQETDASNAQTPSQFDSFSFQVKLYETSNRIEFVYGPMTASANAPDYQTAQIGIRGLNNRTTQSVTVEKNIGDTWNLATAQDAPFGGVGRNFLVPDGFEFSNTAADRPAAGRTFRFDPVTANNDNASVDIYSQGRIAVGVDFPVRVRVSNQTPVTTTHPITVQLNITGPSGYTFTDTKVVATGLAPHTSPNQLTGASVVTFNTPGNIFNPPVLGNYVQTVTITSGDQNAADNTDTYTSLATADNLSYASSAPTAGSVGFPASNSGGVVLARFYTDAADIVNVVQADFSGLTPGRSYKAVVYSATGGGLPNVQIGQSANQTTPNSTGTVNIPLTAPVNVAAGFFFVGLEQLTNLNIGVAYEAEELLRPSTFFLAFRSGTTPFALGAFSDAVPAGNPFRFSIGAKFQRPATNPPICVALQTPADLAINVPVAGSIQFNPDATLGFAADAYIVFRSTNQAAVVGQFASAIVDSLTTNSSLYTGLATNTTYYYKVVARNFLGRATGCAVRSFTTVPPPPSNDNCATPTPLVISFGAVSGTTLSATYVGGGAAAPSCANQFIKDVWYTFNSGTTNVVVVTTTLGTATNLGLELYTGCNPATDVVGGSCLTNLNNGSVGIVVQRNTQYWLRLYTDNVSTPGSFTVKVALPPNLTVASNTTISSNSVLNNVVVPSGVTLTINNGVTPSFNTVTVQNGGTLDLLGSLNVYNAIIQDAGTLELSSAAGIDANGLQGNLLKFTGGTFNLSTFADYNYISAGAQATGSGLPSIVRSLGGPGGALTLTNPLAIRQRLSISTGNILAGGSARSARLRMLSANGLSAFITLDGGGTQGTVTGVVAVDRSINGSLYAGPGYRHLASPVNTTIGDLRTISSSPYTNVLYNNPTTRATLLGQNYPTVFGYDESLPNTADSFDEGWFSPVDTSAALTRGQGVAARMYAFNTPSFVGTLTIAPVTMSGLTSTGSGWHLLGNPYDFPINWTSLTKPSGMDAVMSIFKSSGFNSGSFVPEVNGIPSSINNVIPVGQAFFAHVTTGPVNFTFNRSAATTTDRVVNRAASDTRAVLTLSLAKVGEPANEDQASVYFQDGADVAFNGQFDALKQHAVGTTPSLYTRALGTALAINGLPLLTASDEIVPLGADIKVAGSYTLTVVDQRYFNGTRVFLADALTGTEQELTAGQKYTFTAAAFERTPRFTLHFRPGGVTGLTANALAKQLNVYPNPVSGQPLRVELGGLSATTHAVSARLVNALGQVILTQVLTVSNGSATADLNVTTLAHGLYTLQISAGAEMTSRTVIVE